MPAKPVYPRVYTIAAHRGFADALVSGLVSRYGKGEPGLARLTLLLPSHRTVRTITEAFTRLADHGLLLPRMCAIGDLDLDEALGPLLDPLGAGADIAPASDRTTRWLRLAQLIQETAAEPLPMPAALRQATGMAETIDRLLVEGIKPHDLLSDDVIAIVGEQAEHWRLATRDFLTAYTLWHSELAEKEQLDAPERRNLLFEHAAQRWRAQPPQNPVIAAGITSASPALARLLRVIAELPDGGVILPDLDLELEGDVWDALGTAGNPSSPDEPPFGRHDAVTHPQYHLKLLLGRMGVARGEVQPWHRSGIAAAPPERRFAISNVFLPPLASACWVDLPANKRRLSGVRLMETASPDEEARAIAILIRQALETLERRIALVAPDRSLASRVRAELLRWGIVADDSAGEPLSQTPAGRVLLLLAEMIAAESGPVPLIALLSHPLVQTGDTRAAWLENVRLLDLALRGPRPASGPGPLRHIASRARIANWWDGVEPLLEPLFALSGAQPLATLIDSLINVAEALCGKQLWSHPDGRALAAFCDDLRSGAMATAMVLDSQDLATVLRDAMESVAVRPPWGGHPRIAIYGLLEARMSRADLVICGGLVEGVWPAKSSPDPMLPPAVLRALGITGADFRIGLAAHDLAAALGAPEVVLSWAHRDNAGPVIPSRFILRLQAMLGKATKTTSSNPGDFRVPLLSDHQEEEAVRLARLLSDAAPVPSAPRPEPMPSRQQRLVDLSVTNLDRLRSDPYQFYAANILRLRRIDGLDVRPTAAWQGTAVHAILDTWHKAGNQPGMLGAIATAKLAELSAHPLMRILWQARLLAGLQWIEEETARLAGEGRHVLATEVSGEIQYSGIRIYGRADRFDQFDDGTLAVVDYKTGKPPSRSQVSKGFALQLGLIALLAKEGGFKGISGEPNVFEYWSLGRKDGQIGFRTEPVIDKPDKKGTLLREDFISDTQDYLTEAINRWLLGDEPFTARPNPDLPGVYTDYDQLMRLDEWLLGQGGKA